MAVPPIWPKGGTVADIFFRPARGNAEIFEANSARMFTNDGIINVEACFTNSSGMVSVVGLKEHSLIRVRKQARKTSEYKGTRDFPVRIFHITRIIVSIKTDIYASDETEKLSLARKDISECSTRIM